MKASLRQSEATMKGSPRGNTQISLKEYEDAWNQDTKVKQNELSISGI